MKKKLVLTLSFIVLISISAFLIFRTSGSSEHLSADETTHDKIKAAISESDSSVLKFDEYTDFTWDKLHIIGPYTPLKKYIEENDINWTPMDSSIELIDSINLLVLTDSKKIVSYFTLERMFCDFNLYRNTLTLNKDECFFSIEKTSDGRKKLTPLNILIKSNIQK